MIRKGRAAAAAAILLAAAGDAFAPPPPPAPSAAAAREPKPEKTEAPKDAAAASVPAPAPKERPDPVFELKDGNRFRGKIEIANVEVETKFGIQKVPRQSLVRIVCGLAADPDLQKRIADLVAGLGNPDFAKREQAQQELLTIGLPALEAVKEATRHKDAEIKGRAEAILKIIQDFPGDPPVREDQIVTTEFTMRGRVRMDSFRVESPYGPLQIPRKAVKSIDFLGGLLAAKEFTVTPRFQAPANYANTGIIVRPGDRLKISASGTIYFRRYGQPAPPDGLPSDNYGQWQNEIPNGCLVGRIGSDGTPFRIGSAYQEQASGAGILYLGLGISNPHPSDSGAFKVAVELIPEGQGGDGEAGGEEKREPGPTSGTPEGPVPFSIEVQTIDRVQVSD